MPTIEEVVAWAMLAIAMVIGFIIFCVYCWRHDNPTEYREAQIRRMIRKGENPYDYWGN